MKMLAKLTLVSAFPAWLGKKTTGTITREAAESGEKVDKLFEKVDENETDGISYEILDFANLYRNKRKHTNLRSPRTSEYLILTICFSPTRPDGTRVTSIWGGMINGSYHKNNV